MKLGIIIPVLNESENLKVLLPFINHEKKNESEVIVVDGGSEDESIQTALKLGIEAKKSEVCSRACQLNPFLFQNITG